MAKTKKNGFKSILIKNIIGIVLFFVIIFLIGGYFQKDTKEDVNITLTQLVNDINNEQIKSIKNINDKIEIVYKDETEKFSKKENQSSLTDTFSNLGVDKIKLANVFVSYNFIYLDNMVFISWYKRCWRSSFFFRLIKG